MKEEASGYYRFEDGRLFYSSELYGSWALDLDDVAIIGEYTNQDGPGADDYFFVFIMKEGEAWYKSSFYALNRDEVLAEISKHLGFHFTCGLVDSTDFKSRVIWPTSNRDDPIFEFTRKGWFKMEQKIRAEIIDQANRIANQ